MCNGCCSGHGMPRGQIRCTRNIFMNCEKCSQGKGRPLCPFKCKLSCDDFRCDGLDIRGAKKDQIAMDFSVGGAKGVSTTRTTRMCIQSIRYSIPHPLGRLGNCSGICLGGNRAGHIQVLLSRRTFTCCSIRSRQFMIRGKAFRVLTNPSSTSLPLGTAIIL